MHKHLWLFKQKFGEDITLEGQNLHFKLSVYTSSIKAFKYEWETIDNQIQDCSLPIVCGQSRDGLEVYDMVEHPHLLIAGETGSGKSVCVRQILSTLILSGVNLELYCADLKRSEFHLFKGIAKDVIVEPGKLKVLLKRLGKELKRRGDLLDAAECAHVDELVEKLPYIVIAIDEVALLKKEKDCMDMIEEISAIGRALGYFSFCPCSDPMRMCSMENSKITLLFEWPSVIATVSTAALRLGPKGQSRSSKARRGLCC